MADIIPFAAFRDPADMNREELSVYLEQLRAQMDADDSERGRVAELEQALTERDAELALLHDALRGKRLQLPAAIDVEDARLRALTPDALSALVAGAARQLEHWGLYAMVYTYAHFADTALHMDTLAPFDLWLADYRGKRPACRHGMWQYTSRGRVPGISGPVDLSRTEKDYPALLHRAGLDRTIL